MTPEKRLRLKEAYKADEIEFARREEQDRKLFQEIEEMYEEYRKSFDDSDEQQHLSVVQEATRLPDDFPKPRKK